MNDYVQKMIDSSSAEPPPQAQPEAKLGPIKYSVLKQMHPRLNIDRVMDLKALYHGGKRLLHNETVLHRLLPRYAHEKDAVYAERKKRAFYENIFAQVINFISAGLAQDPVQLAPIEVDPKIGTPPPETDDEGEDEDVDEKDTLPGLKAKKNKNPFAKKGDKKKKESEDEDEDEEEEDEEGGPPIPEKKSLQLVVKSPPPEYDQYWIDIMEDATPFSEDGSRRKTFDQVIRDAAVEALVCGWSWIQADLPPPPSPDLPAPTSLKEQEDSGGLRSYLVPWATENVIDWEEKEGRLLWVRTYQCDMNALSPSLSRETKVHTWTIWEATTWTRYVIEENQKAGKQLPGDETMIEPTTSGTHTFGRVPWTRLDLCADEGAQLHIGDQIESICRAYFNRQNGESYQWVQYYFQQLYEFLAPEIAGIDTAVSEAQQDPGRARRFRAPGEVQVRGHEDKAMFVGPNMTGASEAREAMVDMRDSIYRATAQMALSQDTSGAMLRRSADSKRQDSVAQEIVLGAIGKKVLVLADNAADLLAHGRGDEEAPELRGYEHFDIYDADMLLNRASVVAQIDIPSATYKIEHLYQLAVADLGDSVSESVKKRIRMELEMSITQDALMNANIKTDEDEDPFGKDEEDIEDDEVDPFKKKIGVPKDDEEDLFDKDADKTKKDSKKGSNPFAKGKKS